jgi:uncharacterized protein YggU (UPF0235/DUF167 family)
MAATRLTLRVAPGAKWSEVVGRHGSVWKVRVAAPPADGRANAAVLALVADALALPRSALTLVSGHGSRDKLLDVAGIGPEETERRLAAASAPGKDT